MIRRAVRALPGSSGAREFTSNLRRLYRVAGQICLTFRGGPTARLSSPRAAFDVAKRKCLRQAQTLKEKGQRAAQTSGNSEQVMTHLFQNPRSRWKHNGAKRNPRVTKRNQTERAERATGQALRFAVMKGYRPLRGLSVHTPTIPGVPLRSTPGFMLSPRFAGSRKEHQLIQRFLQSVIETLASANHRLKSLCH